jgi:hypothetical protein
MQIALKSILVVLLLLCLADMPYAFYEITRFIACIGFGIFSFQCFQNERQIEGVIFIVLIVLFQPFEKLALGRTLWNILDVLVSIYLIVSMFLESESKKES